MCLSLLTPEEAPPYAGLALPRYRRWLTSGKDGVVAVGASVLGRPVGLALGGHRPGTDAAHVHGVGVAPGYRRRGLGTALLARLEDEIAGRGARTLRGECAADGRPDDAVEALLRTAGWSTPTLHRVVCMTDLDLIAHAPWMHDYALPEDFETFPWTDLTDADAEHLRTWFPEQCAMTGSVWDETALAPFHEGRTIEPVNSLGLRHRGAVVGWMLTDRVAPDVIRYDRLFVAHRFRRLGLGAMLLAASIWAHHRAENHLRPSHRGVWQTLATNRPMIAFIRRRMKPYLRSLTDIYEVTKTLPTAEAADSPPRATLEADSTPSSAASCSPAASRCPTA